MAHGLFSAKDNFKIYQSDAAYFSGHGFLCGKTLSRNRVNQLIMSLLAIIQPNSRFNLEFGFSPNLIIK